MPPFPEWEPSLFPGRGMAVGVVTIAGRGKVQPGADSFLTGPRNAARSPQTNGRGRPRIALQWCSERSTRGNGGRLQNLFLGQPYPKYPVIPINAVHVLGAQKDMVAGQKGARVDIESADYPL